MTCIDCVTWGEFFFTVAIALFFALMAGLFWFFVRRKFVIVAWIGAAIFAFPAFFFGWAAYRMLFGPNWHGHLLG